MTYDLTVAKMAMEIQIEEASLFDNIFIALEWFHIEMAFFSLIRKYIPEFGGRDPLMKSGIIENGSLTSFLSSKSYKRNKRIRQLLALAMEIQHFNSFKLSLQEDDLEKYVSLDDDLRNVIVGEKKKFVAFEGLKDSPGRQEKGTMTKWHNTGFDMSAYCIFTTNFQEILG